MTQAFNLSQLANFVNSSGQLDASTGLTNTSSLGFPTGTLMLFQQTAAPTGWTKQTTHDNKALRVVSGTASSGGTTAFTTVFASRTPAGTVAGGAVAATTLTTTQMPSHTHIQQRANNGSSPYTYNRSDYDTGGMAPYAVGPTQATGGGGSHTHSFTQPSFTGTAMDFAVQYVDLIIASKN